MITESQDYRTTTQLLRVGPSDFPVIDEMDVYRVTYPAGHYMGFRGNAETRFQLRPFKPLEEGPDPLDARVVNEKVRVQYCEYLDGAVGQAMLVAVSDQGIIRALNSGGYQAVSA